MKSLKWGVEELFKNPHFSVMVAVIRPNLFWDFSFQKSFYELISSMDKKLCLNSNYVCKQHKNLARKWANSKLEVSTPPLGNLGLSTNVCLILTLLSTPELPELYFLNTLSCWIIGNFDQLSATLLSLCINFSVGDSATV